MNIEVNDSGWAVFVLDGQQYAVPVKHVREFFILAKISKIPETPEYMRGVVNLRGSIIPVMDLRMKLGLTSSLSHIDGLTEEMRRREDDHRNWLQELESSIAEDRPFTKAIDPHQCAFGKWYDQYETDNISLRAVLHEFDKPHQELHATAGKALKASGSGDHDRATAIIGNARSGVLSKMLELFNQFRKALGESLREVAVLTQVGERRCGLVVDRLEAVEELEIMCDGEEALQGMGGDDAAFVSAVGRRKDGSIVQLLDANLILAGIPEMTDE